MHYWPRDIADNFLCGTKPQCVLRKKCISAEANSHKNNHILQKDWKLFILWSLKCVLLQSVMWTHNRKITKQTSPLTVFFSFNLWRCLNVHAFLCVHRMSVDVTGSCLSSSLPPDSGVKQGLRWSVYVFENVSVYASGLILFLFSILTLFTSRLWGFPGSCLMDSLALLSWPLAQALRWMPN